MGRLMLDGEDIDVDLLLREALADPSAPFVLITRHLARKLDFSRTNVEDKTTLREMLQSAGNHLLDGEYTDYVLLNIDGKREPPSSDGGP